MIPLFGLIALGIVLVLPSPARADCSGESAAEELEQRADVVFRGRVLHVGPVRRSPEGQNWTPHAVVTFEVLESWKGTSGRRLQVAEVLDLGDLSLGLMKRDEEWVVFAWTVPTPENGRHVVPTLPQDSPTRLTTSGCGGAVRLLPSTREKGASARDLLHQLRRLHRQGAKAR